MATLKQKKAFKEITENHRSISGAMRDVGYSKNTAVKPSNLTKSKGWEELMEEYLPDKLIAKRHLELLNKREKSIVEYRSEEAGGKNIYEVLDQPETQAVSKALEMTYKLKDRYRDGEGDKFTQNNIVIFADDRAKRIARRILDGDSAGKEKLN